MRTLLLLVAATTLLAQAPKPMPARIAGRVVSSTGGAVRAAQVQIVTLDSRGRLANPSRIRAQSDENGSFVLEGIDPAPNLGLVAFANGYVPTFYGGRSEHGPMAALGLKGGESREGFIVTLIPTGTITGLVIDEAGDPAEKVQVSLLQRTYHQRGFQLEMTNRAETNDLGEFRFAGLVPGTYYLETDLRTAAPLPGTRAIPAYYPDVTDPLRAEAVPVAAGQLVHGVTLHLHRSQSHYVRGRVANAPDGTLTVWPLPEAVYQGVFTYPDWREGTSVKADGTFQLVLGPGAYALELSPSGYAAGTLATMHVVVQDHDVEGVVISGSSPARVSGTLRVVGSSFAETFPKAAHPAKVPDSTMMMGNQLVPVQRVSPDALRLSFPRMDASAMRPMPVTVGADGEFTLENLAKGKYALERPSLPGAYVQMMRMADADVTAQELDFEGSRTLEIVMARDGGEVHGAVKDAPGAPMRALTVAVWGERDERSIADRGVRLASTDVHGEFRVADLAPGMYSVLAFEDINEFLAVNREFLGQFATRVVKTEVKAGESAATAPAMVAAEEIQKAMEKMQ